MFSVATQFEGKELSCRTVHHLQQQQLQQEQPNKQEPKILHREQHTLGQKQQQLYIDHSEYSLRLYIHMDVFLQKLK